MTGMHHERASDRCAEALLIVEAEDQCVFDIVVMVQGDEPMVHPEMINEALGPMLIDQSILVTNLLGEINTDEEFDDRNCIKTVIDRNYNALYFSESQFLREPSTLTSQWASRSAYFRFVENSFFNIFNYRPLRLKLLSL